MAENKNILANITSMELGTMTLDGVKPTPVLMVKTARSSYVFRLSETFPIESHADIFKSMVVDLRTELEPEEPAKEQKPVEEKHDGARLFDEPPTFNPTDVEITTKPVATQD